MLSRRSEARPKEGKTGITMPGKEIFVTVVVH